MASSWRRTPKISLGGAFAATGSAAAAAAAAADPRAAGAAASQDWPPFVLVAGLLLVGLVASGDGIFTAAGSLLASTPGSGFVVWMGAMVLVVAVTALLNLDTSVAFLTPVLVATARTRGSGERALLAGCLLLSNAGSLLLPGSNLTNLIVLGQLHLSGGQFAARTAAAWAAGVAVTALVAAVASRRSLRLRSGERHPPAAPARRGVGALAVVTSAVAVVVLRSPAFAVAVIGAIAVGVRLAAPGRHARPIGARQVLDTLGPATLVGLFGTATALGTLARAWGGPSRLLAHAGTWATAGIGAAASVTVNNLPAASLLAAHPPPHPVALLVGLDLGPNLFVTGSLSWLLWRQAGRAAGAVPPVAATVRLGLVTTPLAVVGSLVALHVAGG